MQFAVHICILFKVNNTHKQTLRIIFVSCEIAMELLNIGISIVEFYKQ